jgi:hypothetical protein
MISLKEIQDSIKSTQSYYINLKEIDFYTLSSFEDIKYQCFEQNLDFHICLVKEGDRTYLFNASHFIEDCIINDVNVKEMIKNPLNNQPIEDFKIFVSSKENPDLQLYMTKDELLVHPNHIPILWNDPFRSQEDRIFLMLSYGRIIEKSDPNKAIDAYQKAITLGDSNAKFYLGSLYKELGHNSLSFPLLEEVVNKKCISISNAFFCAEFFEENHRKDLAFKAYHLAADQGNAYGIGEVIQRIKLGVGTAKNPLLAKQWRQKLPEVWQNAPIADFFNHLQKINYEYDQIGYP